MTNGWNHERQAFVQSYGSDTLDASNLIMPLVFFVAPMGLVLVYSLYTRVGGEFRCRSEGQADVGVEAVVRSPGVGGGDGEGGRGEPDGAPAGMVPAPR